jgi:hypothetical protein
VHGHEGRHAVLREGEQVTNVDYVVGIVDAPGVTSLNLPLSPSFHPLYKMNHSVRLKPFQTPLLVYHSGSSLSRLAAIAA